MSALRTAGAGGRDLAFVCRVAFIRADHALFAALRQHVVEEAAVALGNREGGAKVGVGSVRCEGRLHELDVGSHGVDPLEMRHSMRKVQRKQSRNLPRPKPKFTVSIQVEPGAVVIPKQFHVARPRRDKSEN